MTREGRAPLARVWISAALAMASVVGLSGCAQVLTSVGALPQPNPDAGGGQGAWVYAPPTRPGEQGRVTQLPPASRPAMERPPGPTREICKIKGTGRRPIVDDPVRCLLSMMTLEDDAAAVRGVKFILDRTPPALAGLLPCQELVRGHPDILPAGLGCAKVAAAYRIAPAPAGLPYPGRGAVLSYPGFFPVEGEAPVRFRRPGMAGRVTYAADGASIQGIELVLETAE